MHLAEAAAWAIALAARAGCAPADLPVEDLQRQLVTHGAMISFFNDCDMGMVEPWLPAMQFAGTRGFFPDYDACAAAPLDAKTAAAWHTLGMTADDTHARDGTLRSRGEACRHWFERTASPEVRTVKVLGACPEGLY
jgi:hypothetical protein